jgi:hypothetical protein
VVGDAQDRDAGRRRVGDEVGRRATSVRCCCVRVKVDENCRFQIADCRLDCRFE